MGSLFRSFLAVGYLLILWNSINDLSAASCLADFKNSITVCNYAAFLNARAVTDKDSFFDIKMGEKLSNAQVQRIEAPGHYYYHAVEGKEKDPILFINYFEMRAYCDWEGSNDLRFCNTPVCDLELKSNKISFCFYTFRETTKTLSGHGESISRRDIEELLGLALLFCWSEGEETPISPLPREENIEALYEDLPTCQGNIESVSNNDTMLAQLSMEPHQDLGYPIIGKDDPCSNFIKPQGFLDGVQLEAVLDDSHRKALSEISIIAKGVESRLPSDRFDVKEHIITLPLKSREKVDESNPHLQEIVTISKEMQALHSNSNIFKEGSKKSPKPISNVTLWSENYFKMRSLMERALSAEEKIDIRTPESEAACLHLAKASAYLAGVAANTFLKVEGVSSKVYKLAKKIDSCTLDQKIQIAQVVPKILKAEQLLQAANFTFTTSTCLEEMKLDRPDTLVSLKWQRVHCDITSIAYDLALMVKKEVFEELPENSRTTILGEIETVVHEIEENNEIVLQEARGPEKKLPLFDSDATKEIVAYVKKIILETISLTDRFIPRSSASSL